MNAPMISPPTGAASSQRTGSHLLVLCTQLLDLTRSSFRYRSEMRFPILMVPYYGYYLLLLCTPANFRGQVGREIRDHFYDAMESIYESEGTLKLVSFVAYNFGDIVHTAFAIRLEPFWKHLRNSWELLQDRLEQAHFLYFRRGSLSLRITISRPIIDIRLRFSFRMLLMSIIIASLVTAVIVATRSEAQSPMVLSGLF